MNTARQNAIAAVTHYKPMEKPMDFSETPTQELFARNVFSDAVMQARLPKSVYRALRRTIDRGEALDVSVADAVAVAMRDWAIEKGATHYAHVFYPLTGLTAEKHDSFLEPDGRGRRAGGVLREAADPGRARRVEFPLGRHPGHVRGPRLHGVGRDQPGLHPR